MDPSLAAAAAASSMYDNVTPFSLCFSQSKVWSEKEITLAFSLITPFRLLLFKWKKNILDMEYKTIMI